MNEFELAFQKKIQRTHNVVSFQFASKEKVDFLPGQFAQIIFDRNDRSNKNLNKFLSFSCRPGKAYVEFTKKISESAFSKKLLNLKEGDTVLIKAPMGNCVFKDEYLKIGFLVGGIGITPVISIIEYIMDKKLDTDISLFYSNWKADDIAFRPELGAWDRENDRLRLNHVLTECKDDDMKCFSGFITEDIVKNHMSDFKDRVQFIYGPPGMVKAMQEICTQLGCPKENVKAENFVGY